MWLTADQAAAVLRLDPSRVLQLAREGRLPAVRRDRWWFRRDHLESAAARAFARRRQMGR